MQGGGGSEPPWAAWSVDFAAGREPEAFWDGLIDELRPVVARRLRGDQHATEEVLQDTVVGLLERRARGAYDPDRGTVVALAVEIAKRRCADRARVLGRRPSDSLDGSRPGDVPDPAPGPEQALLRAEDVSALRTAFARAIRELQRADARIGSRRAQAVLLRHRVAIAADDLAFLAGGEPAAGALAPWDEVADRLGISVESARQNGSRGLRALRDIWPRVAPGASPPGSDAS
jgi:RNA polymerase sigma factor (sigma-70 family)